jgi:hypothetical protein
MFVVQARAKSFYVVFAIVAALVIPAVLALSTVIHPIAWKATSDNPTPLGYTWSLLLFLMPIAALTWWFVCRPDLQFPRAAFWRTIAVLAPLGFALDLLFGNTFFTFPNEHAIIGFKVPSLGGAIPIEEFVFYLTGFMVVLLSYIWGDEYWMAAYNVPDYKTAAESIPRIVRFHFASVVLGAILIAGAILYRRVFAATPEGFPWYWVYLVCISLVPSTGFFHTAQHFINWRAFSFTFFVVLLISLLWEVTLALPYGWWEYRPGAMMGMHIAAWQDLPIEAPCVWMAVSFTTIIIYETIKIWKALGTRALEAFFGIGK